jgi:Ca2+-binding EF-hand superfamily protein
MRAALLSTSALLAVVTVSTSAPAAHSKAHAAIAALDPDNDSSLDRGEVLRGAIAKFKRLNPDNDGTLDDAELHGVLSAKGLAMANPDGDGTLSLGEYLRLVKRLFRIVNTDGDHTIETDELTDTPRGRLLRRLIY